MFSSHLLWGFTNVSANTCQFGRPGMWMIMLASVFLKKFHHSLRFKLEFPQNVIEINTDLTRNSTGIFPKFRRDSPRIALKSLQNSPGISLKFSQKSPGIPPEFCLVFSQNSPVILPLRIPPQFFRYFPEFSQIPRDSSRIPPDSLKTPSEFDRNSLRTSLPILPTKLHGILQGSQSTYKYTYRNNSETLY